MAKEVLVTFKVNSKDVDKVTKDLKYISSNPIKMVDNRSLKESAALSKDMSSSFSSIGDTLTGGMFSRFKAGLDTSANIIKGMGASISKWAVSIKGATVAETVLNGVRSIGLGIVTSINIMTGGMLIVIGAIVTAIIGVAAYLTKGEEGANRLALIMDGVSVIMDTILDATISYAKLLYSIFTLDYEGMKKNWKDIGKEVGSLSSNLEKQKELSRERAELDKTEREWLVEKSALEKESSRLRAQAREVDKYTLEERQGFLKEVLVLEGEIGDTDVKHADQRYQNLRKQNLLTTTSKADKEKEAKAFAKVNDLETARLNKGRRIQSEMNGLNSKVRGKEKEHVKDMMKLDQKRWKAQKDHLNNVQTVLDTSYIREDGRDPTLKQQKTQNEHNQTMLAKQFLLDINEPDFKPDGTISVKFLKDLKQLKAENARLVLDMKTQEREAYNDLINSDIKLMELRQGDDHNGILDLIAGKKIDALKTEADRLLENEELSAVERLLIENELALAILEINTTTTDKKIANTEREKEAEIANAKEAHESKMAMYNMYANGTIDLLSSLADMSDAYGERTFNMTKALRYGQTIMSTAAGIMNVWADPTLPTVAKIAASISVGATGVTQAINISKMSLDSSAGGGSGSGGGSLPTPQVSNTAPVTSGRALYESEQQGKSMKAYVVMSDLEGANQRQTNTGGTINL